MFFFGYLCHRPHASTVPTVSKLEQKLTPVPCHFEVDDTTSDKIKTQMELAVKNRCVRPYSTVKKKLANVSEM